MTFFLSICVLTFGLLLNTQAAYFFGFDTAETTAESWSVRRLNIAEVLTGPAKGNTEVSVGSSSSYAVANPLGVETLVFASASLAYGFDGSSALYEFVLSDTGVSANKLGTYSLGDNIAITLAGDTLYVYSNSESGGTLYRISNLFGDRQRSSEVETFGLNTVRAIVYDADAKLLYATDGSTLYSTSLTESDDEFAAMKTASNEKLEGVEDLVYEAGKVYAVSDDTLYILEFNSENKGNGVNPIEAVAITGWAADIAGLCSISSAAEGVPQTGSVLAWLLISGGVAFMNRRKRATA
jgi:hypothetical protein